MPNMRFGRIAGIRFVDYNPKALTQVLKGRHSMRFAQGIGREKREIARRLAPVDTGTLRDSINYAVRETDTGWEVLIYATASYAAFVEFGTSRNPKQPFLRPALYSKLRRT